MSLPDIINGLYEAFGSIAVFLTCLRLLKDKSTHGTSLITVAFFQTWGMWNMFYYPHLGQTWSGIAAAGVCFMNTWWFYLVWYYRKHPGGKK